MALLYNEQGKICVVKSEKYGYFQLPGGGLLRATMPVGIL